MSSSGGFPITSPENSYCKNKNSRTHTVFNQTGFEAIQKTFGIHYSPKLWMNPLPLWTGKEIMTEYEKGGVSYEHKHTSDPQVVKNKTFE